MTEKPTEVPRVSIVMPAYNAETTIGEALESVFAQTFRDFEVIVVDDGSTDGTCAALKPWRERIAYERQDNGGPGRARNTGIRRARGELIAFIDADDLWLPDKLARQVEYFDAFPATGLLHTAAFLGRPPRVPAPCHRPFSPPRQVFCEIFETDVEIHTLTVMAPRRVLESAGGFDERREIHVEDWDLWLRVAAAHPVGYLACPLAVHRGGGVMSAALDKTFIGQRLVIERALPEYLARCRALGRDAERRARRPLHRAACELGYARWERDETALARDAFRTALRYDASDLRTHLYHAGSHLPAPVVRALRALKRRARPIATAPRVVPSQARIGDQAPRRPYLIHDTLYRRARHHVAGRLRGADDLLDGLRGRRKRILFEAASPLSFIVFQPLYRRLSEDPRIEFYFTSTTRSWPAEAIFRAVGICDRVIAASHAQWMKLDACVNTDFFEMTWLYRCPVRLHMFHGVAGKYDIDAPTQVAPDIAAFNALLFPNRDRLDRYLQAGLVDERSALLVGFPKIDCLVDGSLDREEIAASLNLHHGTPTVIYAPTWSPDSSLHLMGEAVVRTLMHAGFNVLVKLHDRSYDLTRRASAGIDWMSRLSAYANNERVRIIRDPDASRYLAVADALVTDHSSIGFEYALLDRPIVVLDAPTLLERARVNPEKVKMLRSAAEVIDTPSDLEHAIASQMSDPMLHSAERRRLGREMFYRPGTATDRALSIVYDAIGLEPPSADARAGQPRPLQDTAGAPVAQPDRKVS